MDDKPTLRTGPRGTTPSVSTALRRVGSTPPALLLLGAALAAVTTSSLTRYHDESYSRTHLLADIVALLLASCMLTAGLTYIAPQYGRAPLSGSPARTVLSLWIGLMSCATSPP